MHVLICAASNKRICRRGKLHTIEDASANIRAEKRVSFTTGAIDADNRVCSCSKELARLVKVESTRCVCAVVDDHLWLLFHLPEIENLHDVAF